MSSSAHPLPAPPGQQRPRAKSSFSLHSHKSSGSNHKVNMQETHEEKESRRLQTKADPTMAITEAEPSAVASGVKSSLASIRSMQHRDSQGNPIADPDRSNPTRSRWERPLDTIRSFEAAIDGGYSRKSYMRKESADSPMMNRRGSYYANQGPTDEKAKYYQNSYYGGRSQSQRPESTYMDGRSNRMGRPDSYYSAMDGNLPSNGYHPNRARHPRPAAEPQSGHGLGVYPAPGNQPSYETVTTASGSGSSADPTGYSTDPSSDNSSLDRIAAVGMKEPSENYGLDAFGNNPQYPQYGSNGAQRQGNGYLDQGPPSVLRKGVAAPARKAPIKLGSTSGNAGPAIQVPPPAGEKRKSWFGRRFSKAA